MPFFQKYPAILYKFGNESFNTRFPDLVRYSEILDSIKLDGSYYQKYTIKKGERPDQVSYKLYNNELYHWTFYYLNDNLRESGWPLSYNQIEDKIDEAFPNTVITTREEIFDKFLPGDTITGVISEASGTIIKRNLDLGLIFVEGSVAFNSGELMNDGTNTITTVSSTPERSAPLYYTDLNGDPVDIDPFTYTTGALSYTHEQYYYDKNDELTNIVVLKPNVMSQFIQEFKRAMIQ